jgi:hypothetical protein
MNEFQGTVVSVEADTHLLRMNVDGGYSVQFTYNSKTTILDGHDPIKPFDLTYGDKIIARYVGKELYAKEIVRTAPAPALTAVPTEPVTPAEPIAAVSTSTVQSVVSSVTLSTPTP